MPDRSDSAADPSSVRVERLTFTRIPTVDGTFHLALYGNSRDEKDHLALVHGDVEGAEDVLVRVHSECFTGDVVGSLRCDCGEQLSTSMRLIAREGCGIVLYLRQEGRGIGLLDKLKAYDLQDEGYDTVEANLMLGHGADERDYTLGALMLRDLGVRSVRLLTNNPSKIENLRSLGVDVTERVALEPHLNEHNAAYLRTKVDRMRHLLQLGPRTGARANPHGGGLARLVERMQDHAQSTGQPFVTLTYAQSLDGSIAATPGQPLAISSDESMTLTHELRAAHDAILVGIGTVLSDDPRLTVRRAEGDHPRPVVLDSRLRLPPDARLLATDAPPPLVATSEDAPAARCRALEAAGAEVVRLPRAETGGLCLDALLDALAERGYGSLMVEGGSEVITSFIREQRADHLILTVAPMLVGGVPALGSLRPAGSGDGAPDDPTAPVGFPRLRHVAYRWIGDDLVLEGDPFWGD